VPEEKTPGDVRLYVERTASRLNWKLNADADILETLVAGLTSNVNRLGYYNCPCRDTRENRSLDRDIICPCLYAREADVEEFGYCYCALFFRADYDQSKGFVMIPERRPSRDPSGDAF
jgi:ferredoxin-thioredoxin reductase catalytic subunit